MTTLLEAIDILEQKVKKGKKHFDITCGICDNIASITRRYENCAIKRHAETWPQFSGDAVFPIGSEQVYLHHKEHETLWLDEQLKLRLSLLSHIKRSIKEENRIAKYNASMGATK